MGVESRGKQFPELSEVYVNNISLSPACLELMVCGTSPLSATRQHITELYDRLRPCLHAYLSLRGLSKENSEDVIQEAFLRLVRQFVSRGPDGNPRAWVFRVAHNLSMDVHRSAKREAHPSESGTQPLSRERIDPAPDPEQIMILRERLRHLREAVAQLTPKQRYCLLLRAQGLRYREIAEAMGISVQRVGELMQRATSLIGAGVSRR